jgi:hypothetical protein
MTNLIEFEDNSNGHFYKDLTKIIDIDQDNQERIPGAIYCTMTYLIDKRLFNKYQNETDWLKKSTTGYKYDFRTAKSKIIESIESVKKLTKKDIAKRLDPTIRIKGASFVKFERDEFTIINSFGARLITYYLQFTIAVYGILFNCIEEDKRKYSLRPSQIVILPAPNSRDYIIKYYGINMLLMFERKYPFKLTLRLQRNIQ